MRRNRVRNGQNICIKRRVKREKVRSARIYTNQTFRHEIHAAERVVHIHIGKYNCFASEFFEKFPFAHIYIDHNIRATLLNSTYIQK